jgi:hypothetical protein
MTMIYDFQDALSRRLLAWSALSIIAGTILLIVGDGFWRGLGLQAIVWGMIDAAIAIFGSRSAHKRRAAGQNNPEVTNREARNLRKLLWINTWLDVLYIAGGFAVLFVFGGLDPFAAGNGIGIVLQGSFLFLFDLLHVRVVPMTVSNESVGME